MRNIGAGMRKGKEITDGSYRRHDRWTDGVANMFGEYRGDGGGSIRFALGLRRSSTDDR